jgi:hypothetical protein
MDEQDAKAALQRIKGHIVEIGEHAAEAEIEVDALLAAMEGEPPDPSPELPEKPAVDTQHVYLDPIWGGPIGSGSRKVVENSEWKGKSPRFAADTDYVNPRFYNMSVTDREYIGQDIPKNVRLFNPTFENITGAEHFIYINMGHSEEKNEIGLVIFGGYSKGLKAKETWAEFKATRILIEDHVVEGTCASNQYVRQRHGRQLVMVGGRGKGLISCRGWCHYIDVPGSPAQSWAGPLPYRSVDWMKMHTGEDGPWKGKAYQGTELMYFGARVTKATVGLPSYKQPSDYEALNNVVHPAVRDVELKDEKGTKREALGGFRELWKRAGLC